MILINAVFIDAQKICQYSKNLREHISETQRLPHNLTIKCLKKLEEEKKNKQIGMMIFGGILGFLAAPLIVPLFAGAGLYGAAAYSSGLAALGGGSLASGGFGMAGGALVLKGINIGIMMILESQIKMPEGIKNIELEDSISAKYCEIPKYRYFDYIFDKSGKLIYEGEFQGINLANKGFIYFEGKKYETFEGKPKFC